MATQVTVITGEGSTTYSVSTGARGPAGPAGTGGGGGGVTSVATGTGLTGGPVTTTGTIALANTAVTAGLYQAPFIQVDAQGRLTKALDEPCSDEIHFSGGALVAGTFITATGVSEWDTPVVSAVARTGIFSGIATGTSITLVDLYTFSSTAAVSDFLQVTGGGFDHVFNVVKSEIIVQSSTEIITRLTGSVTNSSGTALPTRPAIAIFRVESNSTFTLTLKVQKEFLYTGTSPVVVTGRAISLAATTSAGTYATPSSITVDATGRVTAATAGSSAGTVTGTAPIVVTSGVISLSTTLPSAYEFTNVTRPTSAATTGTLAAANAQSLITKGDVDSRFIRNNVTTLPTATYTSSSGQNQAWLTESWIIPAQTNGLSPNNSSGGFVANGFFVAHNSGIGKSLQIFPALTIGANNAIAGTITDGGVFNSTFCFNVGGGAVDLLVNVVSSRMKLSGSGVASQYFRYRFATNFAANAGDIIVMSPSGHTFVVDTTITNATVFTNASTGGVTVRSVTGGSSPTTADTSLTVNGGASISTTYQINSATNTGVHPSALLFFSSTGIHLLSTQYGANGVFRLSGIY